VAKGIYLPAPDVHTTPATTNIASPLMSLLLLRAFASGCSALTGIESIAGGVAAFEPPKSRNAQITMFIMAFLLCFSFLGITYLARKFNINFSSSETVISQIARKIFGGGFMYYVVQSMTALILLLAANTSFASFPRLASILAREKYIPTRFANLGDRLAFSNGIVMLAIVATLLIYVFKADCHALIPLYSMGVFLSFTLSQAGMVRRIIKLRKRNWQIKCLISFCGTIATLITLLIIVESKFRQGAWIVIILMAVLFYAFKKISARYKVTNFELDLKRGSLCTLLRPLKEAMPKVVVPVSRIHKGTLAALRFAGSLSSDVVAVIVNTDPQETDKLKLTWRSMNFNIPLVILPSPYRSIVNPFFDFLVEQDERDPERGKSIVVMSSFVPGKMWQNVLHNQTATFIKAALLYKNRRSEQTRVIVEIPYQMKM
jgi:hypothetical protein